MNFTSEARFHLENITRIGFSFENLTVNYPTIDFEVITSSSTKVFHTESMNEMSNTAKMNDTEFSNFATEMINTTMIDDTELPSFTTEMFNTTTINGTEFAAFSKELMLAFPILSSIVGIIIFCGFIINTLTLVFLGKQKKKTSTEIFFIGVTVCDLELLCENMYILVSTALLIYFNIEVFSELHSGFELVSRCLLYLSKASTAILMSVLAIERHFAVNHPLQFRLVWTSTLGRVICLSTFLVTSAVSVALTLFKLDFVMEYILMGLNFVSALIIVISNGNVLLALSRRKETESWNNVAMKTMVAKEQQQAKILVSISLIYLFYLFSQVVEQIVLLSSSGHFEDIFMFVSLFVAMQVNAIIQMLNFCLNSIIFIIANAKYRKKLKTLF